MIWRILALFSVITVFAYADKTYGREAAWAAVGVLNAILLPLSAIERRLGALVGAQRKRTTSRETRP